MQLLSIGFRQQRLDIVSEAMSYEERDRDRDERIERWD
jgi:hypothetical protein